jgi:hypothetical protein
MDTMTDTTQTQGWRLFLDDERIPTWDLGEVDWALDSDLASKIVLEHGTVPEWISLDHDLGKDESGAVKPTAMKFLWWLIDMDLDGHLDLREIKRVIIHSRNPEGSKNLAGLWDGYAADIGSPVRAELRPRQSLTK